MAEPVFVVQLPMMVAKVRPRGPLEECTDLFSVGPVQVSMHVLTSPYCSSWLRLPGRMHLITGCVPLESLA